MSQHRFDLYRLYAAAPDFELKVLTSKMNEAAVRLKFPQVAGQIHWHVVGADSDELRPRLLFVTPVSAGHIVALDRYFADAPLPHLVVRLVQDEQLPVGRDRISGGHLRVFDRDMMVNAIEVVVIGLGGPRLVHKVAPLRKVPPEQVNFAYGQRFTRHDSDPDTLELKSLGDSPHELTESAWKPLKRGQLLFHQPLRHAAETLHLRVPWVKRGTVRKAAIDIYD